MKIVTSLVGLIDHDRELKWPDGWPVPNMGDSVHLSGTGPLAVRVVEWYPEGEGDDPDPFVYIVVGPPRPVIA